MSQDDKNEMTFNNLKNINMKKRIDLSYRDSY